MSYTKKIKVEPCVLWNIFFNVCIYVCIHNMAPIVQQPSEVRFPELNRCIKMDVRRNMTSEEIIKINLFRGRLVSLMSSFWVHGRLSYPSESSHSGLAHRSIVHISVS